MNKCSSENSTTNYRCLSTAHQCFCVPSFDKTFVINFQVGVIILYDHVHPVGAFAKTSNIDVSIPSINQGTVYCLSNHLPLYSLRARRVNVRFVRVLGRGKRVFKDSVRLIARFYSGSEYDKPLEC